MSANIQSRGYINVDALDEDMPTLRKLQSNKLYRNYIWREVSGIGSTGIREESYDVVITAGGFASNAMSPNDITEVFLSLLHWPNTFECFFLGVEDFEARWLHDLDHENCSS